MQREKEKKTPHVIVNNISLLFGQYIGELVEKNTTFEIVWEKEDRRKNIEIKEKNNANIWNCV
jgi:hypothetical protein